MLSGSKRKAAMKKQGRSMFAPDAKPCYTGYGGVLITDEYDRACFLEGWNKERSSYESILNNREESEVRND